jgi:transposase
MIMSKFKLILYTKTSTKNNEVIIIRKVLLTMTENEKYNIIKKLVDSNGNKKAAALQIGCSLRHVYRLIAGYKKNGKAFFIHGNHSHKPVTTIPAETRQRVLHLYQSRYAGANLTHFQELLSEQECIHISTTSISAILRKHYLLSPKAHRSTRKTLCHELKQLHSKAKTMKQQAFLASSLQTLEDPHPRRPRSAFFGEMIQMDASEYRWFGNTKTHLHVAVDDSTGMIVGAWFDTQETLLGYYNVLHQILTRYGIPYQFFTDNRTVFNYSRKSLTDVEKDTFTQFGYACKQLGIHIRTSSVPQAKGRVERMNNTLQSRLPVELRLNGISSLDEANQFLYSYIKKFNKRFALPVHHTKSVFETQPDPQQINLKLAILSDRKIDNGCCLKYHNDYYLPVDASGQTVHYRKGTSVIVIKAFDGALYGCIGEQVFRLEMLPQKYRTSKEFNPSHTPCKPKKKYIPPMSHPWKKASFDKFLTQQAHRKRLPIIS